MLRLPHTDSNKLVHMFTNIDSIKRTEDLSVEMHESSLIEKPKAPAYLAYLRASSRILGREFKQRERLMFLAASSLTSNVAGDSGLNQSPQNLGGVRLSKEVSARARARRKKSEV